MKARNRLHKLISGLGRSLRLQERHRDLLASRMRARHAGQEKYERQQQQAEQDARQLRTEARRLLTFGPGEDQAKGERKLKKAQRLEDKAHGLAANASNQEHKAVVLRGRTRRKTQQIHKIETDLGKAEKELAALGPHVDFKEQVCTGGTFEQRWHASHIASWKRYEEGIRAGRYSQEGVANIHLPYGPGPRTGRDDCSSFERSQCLATGADDPSGHDFGPEGFTGDMAEANGRWKEVSLAEMMRTGQGFIIYGSGSGHHTEGFVPTKAEPERTIGHGDEAVNPGTIHIFGPGEVERYYIFLGK